jgi:hypothetical protein
MSEQVSISAGFSVLAMAAFALFAPVASGAAPVSQTGAETVASAPITHISATLPLLGADQFTTTVTARRFCAQADSLEPVAAGRSSP